MRKVITHLITDLKFGGGAEKMLYQILRYGNKKQYEYKVISLLPNGEYKEKIEQLGIKVKEVDLRKRPFISIKNIIKTLKGTDTLFCWMYYANFIGYICGKLAKVKKINFGIRHSNINKKLEKITTFYINKIGAKMSYQVQNVIYNGDLAKKNHEILGYDKRKSRIIENGCNLKFYQYNKKSKELLLEQNANLRKDTIWIISACRYNKIKDIPTFLEAIKKVKEKYQNIQVIMCGNEIQKTNEKLLQKIQEKGLIVDKDIFLMGIVKNLPDYFSACDIYVLHSVSEAFPNTLIEAMACEIECITTDIGDIRNIFPNKEHIIEPQNPEAMANQILKIIKKQKINKRKDYREIVKNKYSIENIVKYYERYN